MYEVLVHGKHENRMIIGLLEILAPLNSAINPLIYGVFSTRICGNLRFVWLLSRLRLAVSIPSKFSDITLHLDKIVRLTE